METEYIDNALFKSSKYLPTYAMLQLTNLIDLIIMQLTVDFEFT